MFGQNAKIKMKPREESNVPLFVVLGFFLPLPHNCFWFVLRLGANAGGNGGGGNFAGVTVVGGRLGLDMRNTQVPVIVGITLVNQVVSPSWTFLSVERERNQICRLHLCDCNTSTKQDWIPIFGFDS